MLAILTRACLSLLSVKVQYMEKRIRIVWILSLLSIVLLILMQGYWLYNQYVLVVGRSVEELGQRILAEAQKEYSLRKSDVKTSYSFMIDANSEYIKADTNSVRSRNRFKMLMNTIGESDSIDWIKTKVDTLRQAVGKAKDISANMSLKFEIADNQSQGEMLDNINRAVVDLFSPFSIESLDSILTAGFPELDFTVVERDDTDSIHESLWKRAGNVFRPAVRALYVYSPYQDKGVYIDAALPALGLFRQMAVQLLLTLVIVLLLIGCFVFQMKTILKQKKVGELRQSFVNTMIHELKRPVQTLKTFVAFLSDKEMRADQQATEAVIQDSMFELDNLSAYLIKLKDMVRADSEYTPLNPTVFDLRELINKVIRLTHIPEGKRVTFTTCFDDNTRVEADPIHLANVLSNLIENAIKYSDAEVGITIEIRRKGKELWLTVSDDGIGIPLADHDKVFVKFYRGSNLPDRNIPGLGLGLSYVKLIAEAHRGTVSLTSGLGQGTSITLYLPQ